MAEFHTIDNVESSVEDFTSEAGIFSATIHTSVNMSLLANSPEELLAVQGLLSAVGVDAVIVSTNGGKTLDLMTADIETAQLTMANTSRSRSELAIATRVLNDQLSEVRSYIGEQQNINYFTKVSGTMENGSVTIAEILAEDGAGGYCPMSSVLPESPECIYSNYKSAMWLTAEVKAAQAARSDAVALTGSKYDRLAARDYARKWVYGFGEKSGEPTNVLCSVCRKRSQNCDSYSAWGYYNSPTYSIYNHNDCANFASQALAAGGLDDNGNV